MKRTFTMLAAALILLTPTWAHAQAPLRTLDANGCVIERGRSSPPNGAYAYTYVLENRCDWGYRVYYTVNGNSREGFVAGRSRWEYPVLNSETFSVSGVAEY